MAPRAKAARRSSMMESDSEPDFDSFDTAGNVFAEQNPLPQKSVKARGRPVAANRVTKSVRKGTRQTTAKAMTSGKASPGRALIDKSNAGAPRASTRTKKATIQDDDEITMVDQLEVSVQIPSKAPRGRPRASKNHKGGVTSNLSTKSSTTTTQGPPAVADSIIADEIPETQDANLMATDQDLGQLPNLNEPWILGPGDGSGDGVLESEVDEISTRKRLEELRQKYESLETRHRDLREVGVKMAERNFERLKRQTEENTAAANKLISQLKGEVAAQSKRVQQAELLRKQLEQSEVEISTLRTKLSDVSGALSEARTEIKTMSAKLAASRTAEANAKGPGNGLKAAAAGNRTQYTEMLQGAQATEDLYSDLTGLIVRDVRRFDKEDVFDCLQTGRNGTLHFKLALEKADTAQSYEDVQFTYRPQLDANRDSELMDVLPDYLTEEITFPRPQASKFYTRVTKSLMERPE